MNIEIRDLNKKDYNKARKYAIKGMNLKRYTQKGLELYFYSKYFIYLELLRATQILGAYMGDNLVGVLLADINNKPTSRASSISLRYFSLGAGDLQIHLFLY